jgi:hypothetical protein
MKVNCPVLVVPCVNIKTPNIPVFLREARTPTGKGLAYPLEAFLEDTQTVTQRKNKSKRFLYKRLCVISIKGYV